MMTHEEVYKLHQQKNFQDKTEKARCRKEYLAELKRTVLSSGIVEQIEKNLIESGYCDIY